MDRKKSSNWRISGGPSSILLYCFCIILDDPFADLSACETVPGIYGDIWDNCVSDAVDPYSHHPLHPANIPALQCDAIKVSLEDVIQLTEC